MKRYACSILYQYNEKEVGVLLKSALDKLGFYPKFMDIYFNEMKDSFDDIPYDSNYLRKILKRDSGTITIKSQLYDDGKRETNNWFRIGFNIDSPFGLDTCLFEWSNADLDFLLSDDRFDFFLCSPNLMYCYVYDQYDCMNQSNERIDSYIINYPGRAYNVVKNFMNVDVVDVSQHWGRYISTRGITFMAAPLMWFGNEYFKIVPKDVLLKFNGASIVSCSSFDLVRVRLFDLYDGAEKEENRLRQEEFWRQLDLQKKAEQYEKDRPFDFLARHKERAIAMKKRKK